MPKRSQMPAVVAAALLAGPKILMLFPVWPMGVCFFRKMPHMSQAVAWLVFGLTVVIADALMRLNVAGFSFLGKR